MKRNFFILSIPVIFITLFSSGCAHNVKQYWPDGTLKSTMLIKSGQNVGPAVWYFENGKKMLECNYQDNKLEGLFRRYYDNGTPKEEFNYKSDKRHGPFKTWDRLGRVKETGNYLNGMMDGAYKKFYKLGTIEEEGEYSAGQFNGKWFYYDPYGHMIGIKIFDHGKLLSHEGIDPGTVAKKEEEEE
ncbi:MAG: hypothetical protein Q8867_05295 [Bacteroidota bacterium]|nr:hypothetical protein [Bacteroidota bacterium]